MQKVLSYLYPNRVQILANLTGFTVEYTNVYQRNVKIYNGIDNTIEFDIKNADQKRIDLNTLGQIQLNVMDASGLALPNSPYTVTPTALKGIANVTIPQEDLVDLTDQYLRFSLTTIKDGVDVILYSDTKFGAVGTIELIGNAMPVFRDDRKFDTFTAEIDLQGMPIFHSSAIPAKFYEAVPTETLDFEINVTGFVGSIWIEATKNSTANVEAFKAAGKPFGSWTQTFDDGMYTGAIPFGNNIPVGEYNYFRISYQTPSINGLGATFEVQKENNEYTVIIRNGGTGYGKGSLIKILGSQLGGVNGVNDIIITVNAVFGSTSTAVSSYTISEISSIDWQGTASAGVGTYIVSGINYSGVVDNIIVR